MAQSLLSPASIPLKLKSCAKPRSCFPISTPKFSPLRRNFLTKAVISEIPNEKKFPKVGAESTGPIPAAELLKVVESAAKAGAEVMEKKVPSFKIFVLFLYIILEI